MPIWADTSTVQDLLDQLAKPELPNWQMVEDAIWTEWSKSGSPSMDLLLQRGRTAMEEGDFGQALEHFSALVDHAPDFAEGYNMRATAYFNLGLYGPATHDIGTVLSLNPDHFGALTGLGAILEQSQDADRALAAYRAAAAIHPHDPDLKSAIERLEEQVEGIDL
ncbi:TPR repeat-containing protein [Actibacterium atlanticum]|uniref:TPR repeat-containing protein n=1 Tax=Actibacterium atlanticum TaxID=1461693 RepID=A0A058ZI99_9RHOB|nr:tetratricopeptide repeat protein [Actibacterium atlanticum]KCV80927.1 TPR repeat-containing protein [Actibacterium atlanticum]